MKPQIWFLTGSQHLYGPETLQQVADQSAEIQRTLAALEGDGGDPDDAGGPAGSLPAPRPRPTGGEGGR